MRISDWSSDVCSSDLILNLSPVGDVDAAGIDEAQIIGVDIAERSGDGQPVARRADVAAERPASFEFDALKARLAGVGRDSDKGRNTADDGPDRTGHLNVAIIGMEQCQPDRSLAD